jgi:hypothetical protein
MLTDEDLKQFWETDEGKRIQQQLRQLQPEIDRMLDAVRHSETLGDLGWAFPLDMQPRDYVRIAEESTSYEKADAAFLNYYTHNNGQAYKRLMDVIINDSALQECKEFLEEVRRSYDDGRYRVCVAALLPVLDHIAQKIWDAPLSIKGKAHKLLERKIGLLPDSFADHFWKSMKAFLDRVFDGVGKSKPLTLNRHWILHGRGISDGTQVDSLRLLQAIRTFARLIAIGKLKPSSGSGVTQSADYRKTMGPDPLGPRPR